jgi:hypothetical protein
MAAARSRLLSEKWGTSLTRQIEYVQTLIDELVDNPQSTMLKYVKDHAVIQY